MKTIQKLCIALAVSGLLVVQAPVASASSAADILGARGATPQFQYRCC